MRGGIQTANFPDHWSSESRSRVHGEIEGDEIGLTWNNKNYLYKVTSINEVSPDQTGIEDNTTDARLTIFTCTPLWNPIHRLVIVAELESKT